MPVYGWAGDAFGTWTTNPARSTVVPDPRPKSITIRIESHPKGEIFTLDRMEADGRSTTVSTILYLDGTPQDYQDPRCSGTQSSRRVDGRTVEILRTCANGLPDTQSSGNVHALIQSNRLFSDPQGSVAGYLKRHPSTDPFVGGLCAADTDHELLGNTLAYNGAIVPPTP